MPPLTAFVSPIVAGRMLHLTPSQIQHAIGISASARATLGAVTAGKLTMMKNTVDPFATQSGVLAALLAEKGYTGPEHVIDGKEGLVHCLGPAWELNVLTDGLGDSWRITQCGMKAFPTEALTLTPISAVLSLVKDYNLQPHDIAKVHIRTTARGADILSDPSKYDPHTKETADHSLPYVIAAAIADRQVTPSQFTPAEDRGPRDSRTTLQDRLSLPIPRLRRSSPRCSASLFAFTPLTGESSHNSSTIPRAIRAIRLPTRTSRRSLKHCLLRSCLQGLSGARSKPSGIWTSSRK